MKQDTMILLALGGVALYLISRGSAQQAQTQAALNQNALQTGGVLANVNTISSAAEQIAGDFASVF